MTAASKFVWSCHFINVQFVNHFKVLIYLIQHEGSLNLAPAPFPSKQASNWGLYSCWFLQKSSAWAYALKNFPKSGKSFLWLFNWGDKPAEKEKKIKVKLVSYSFSKLDHFQFNEPIYFAMMNELQKEWVNLLQKSFIWSAGLGSSLVWKGSLAAASFSDSGKSYKPRGSWQTQIQEHLK